MSDTLDLAKRIKDGAYRQRKKDFDTRYQAQRIIEVLYAALTKAAEWELGTDGDWNDGLTRAERYTINDARAALSTADSIARGETP